jgi:hypothetical protein
MPVPEAGSSMSLKTFNQLIQGTEEWHDQRRGMVTASTVGGLISIRPVAATTYPCPECEAPVDSPCVSKAKRNGEAPAPIKTIHPARTAVARESYAPPVPEVSTGDEAKSLTAVLTAERITNYTEVSYINDDMLRGIEDEPRAVDKYIEHFAPVTSIGFMVRDDWGFNIGYSPDGLVGDNGLIEVKSRRQKKQLSTIVADQVPIENMAQLQAGLLVSGREWIDYISYAGGMPMYVKRVFPDSRWFEVIIAAVERFEKTSAEMIATYNARAEGLPRTERVIELEMVI